MTQDSNVYYTVEEIARMLRVSARTVRKLIEEGKLKAFRVGNQWRVRQEALDEYASDGSSS